MSMVLLDFLVGVNTPKLHVPDKFAVSKNFFFKCILFHFISLCECVFYLVFVWVLFFVLGQNVEINVDYIKLQITRTSTYLF
jgi:hypothetical protein